MNKMRFWILILFVFAVVATGFSCGGGSGTESDLGPIVDSSGGLDDGPHIIPICDQTDYDIDESRTLHLEISNVVNGHNALSFPNPDQFDPLTPIEIFTGDTHQYGLPEPAELQTRVQFGISSNLEQEVSVPADLTIRFVFLDLLTSGDLIYDVASITRDHGIMCTEDPLNPDYCGVLPAFFSDEYSDPTATGPGFFDSDDFPTPPPDLDISFDWNNRVMVGQICAAAIEIDGEEIYVTSNPIYFEIKPGFGL